MPKRAEEPGEPGVVAAVHPNASFTVHLADGRDIAAVLSGRLRTYSTRLTVGNRVLVQCSTYDPSRGRVVARDRAEGDEPGAARRVLR